MDNLHRVFGVANLTRAFGRLTNLASVKSNIDRVVADGAAEESILHVGNDGGCANYQALDANQAVHVWSTVSFNKAMKEVLDIYQMG